MTSALRASGRGPVELQAGGEAMVDIVESAGPLDCRRADDGEPRHGGSSWRARRVRMYELEHYGQQPKGHEHRPFFQDYRHYRYFGYAGMGAKTAWAHNPKQAVCGARPESPMPGSRQLVTGEASSPIECHFHSTTWSPTKATTGGSPQRSSRPRASPRSSGAKQTRNSTPQRLRSAPTYRSQESAIVVAELPGEMNSPTMRTKVEAPGSRRVLTYPTVAKGSIRGEKSKGPANPAGPFNKKQPPFHQRYNHYKYHGFAGHGAKTSWASNPKVAVNL